jgi:hypothetical protein
MSLRVALETLGFGPCHHMEVVIDNKAHHTPMWNAALAGHPDWSAIYQGFNAAVDWPTASFYRELAAVYPEAKFVLTHRDPMTWAESFSETIYLGVGGRAEAPEPVRPWLDMCAEVIGRAGFPMGLTLEELAERFTAHNEAVKAAIPAERLLLFQVKEGWDPLCEFLGVPVPEEPFPRRNDRAEFWQLMEDGGV